MEKNLDYVETLDQNFYLLEHLVNINSQTKNIWGVNDIQEIISSELSNLQFKNTLIENSLHPSGNFLISEYKHSDNFDFTLSIVVHADTVIGPHRNFKYSTDIKQEMITRPGVSDIKGGIIVALIALKKFLSRNKHPRFKIRFISSPNEELGSIGFHDLLKEIGSDSNILLGMEPANIDGSIISSRNGNRWYDFKISGISAHSGRFGVPQLNASHEAAIKIAKLHLLNNSSKKIKVNVGSIKGGDGNFNIVCGEVSIKLDTRFPSLQESEVLHEKIVEILNEKYIRCEVSDATCKVAFEITDDCPAFSKEQGSLILIDAYMKIQKDVERFKIQDHHSGGASDINYMTHSKAATLDGLGVIGGGLHTENEFANSRSIHSRSEVLFRLLEEINISLKTENLWRAHGSN